MLLYCIVHMTGLLECLQQHSKTVTAASTIQLSFNEGHKAPYVVLYIVLEFGIITLIFN